MKKIILYCMLLTALSMTSCFYRAYERLTKSTITVEQAVKIKVEIDKAENPAKKELLENEIKKKLLELKNVVVKDIRSSTNIDYSYAIVIEVNTKMGKVHCYVYTKDVADIADLKKGKTKINVLGNFGRFFKLLDDAFVNIDILHSDISIVK